MQQRTPTRRHRASFKLNTGGETVRTRYRRIGAAVRAFAFTWAWSLLCAAPVAAQDGVSPNRILIGQSAAFSGPASELGTEMRSGALAYFEQANKRGGVHGRKIEVTSIDDGYEPDRAA